jgi:hypothetical protein
MSRFMRFNFRVSSLVLLTWLSATPLVEGQSVGLPAPRLLTTTPLGGQVGEEFDVVIGGDFLEDVESLHFSDPGITATPKVDDNGQPVPLEFIVRIDPATPLGLHEARVMTRLGISTSRIFSVGDLPEVTCRQGNTSVESALELTVNSVCNSHVSERAVDHYAFQARKGQRIVIDCAAPRIDSKLTPVLIVANSQGRDLAVERRGGALDFSVPEDGTYFVKVHDLTFKGGPPFFYRLVLRELAPDSPLVRHPSTRAVNAFSWPPTDLPEEAELTEVEPNDRPSEAQRITLPCDIAGSFYPAADVDTFEFMAEKGEVWWVEVGSERLGLSTAPAILVQHVRRDGSEEKLTDVAEFRDIPSPVKPSSNAYAYDGPPYNGGSTDILAKLEIQEDGLHRLQIRDLFGGTRNDPQNVYRLVIRRPTPDFTLVAWAMHMELRNGDRNALSKPLALRGGTTMALEVVAIRRDGFDGSIELTMDSLPPGVTASGLTIPAGQSRGLMLVSASPDAPRGMSSATFEGRAEIEGEIVTRPCRLTSMAWPVPDHWQEIPRPRLLSDVPVSVSGSALAPLTITPTEDRVWEVTEGEKLTIPLDLTRRSEFLGATMGLKTFGPGFEGMAKFDIPLTEDRTEAILDLAALKTPPGEYLIAFYGSAVAQYRHFPEAVPLAEKELADAEREVTELAEEADRLAEVAKTVSEEARAEAQQAAAEAQMRHQKAVAKAEAANQRLKVATEQAQPKDIVDIIVSEPISIRVHPAEEK